MSPSAVTKRLAKRGESEPKSSGAEPELKPPGAGPKPSYDKADASVSPDTPALTALGEQWTNELTELGLAFRRVFRTLSRLRGRDTHLGGSELSHAQFELLIELYERGALPAGELAAAARLTPGTVTQMLDHLAEQGHVERVRSDTDRRVVVSRLTPQGKRKIEAKRAAWQARWEQALGDMDSSDLRVATRVLERLSAVFEDVPAAGPCVEEQVSAGASDKHA